MHTKSERLTGISMPRKRVARSLVSILVFGLIQTVIAPQIFYSQAQAATAGTGGCLSTVSDASASAVDVLSVSNYCVLKFKSGTNAWTPPAGVSNVRVLVIGGGGSGGWGRGGGGGAGGFYENPNVSVTNTPYTVEVGAGGVGTSTSSSAGGSSTFGSITVNGGGGGGGHSVWTASNTTGASAGGTGMNYLNIVTTAPTVTAQTILSVSVFANAGANSGNTGNGTTDSVRNTGGGGGAGSAGVSGTGGTDQFGTGGTKPDGGSGKASDITGSSTDYAAGGGGAIAVHVGEYVSTGAYYTAGSGAGGKGPNNSTIGGAGANITGTSGAGTYVAAGSGAPNTGSGGGGGGDGGGAGGNGTSAYAGGSGGSGVVIIRWVPLSLTSGTKALTIAESQTVYLVAIETTSGLSSTTRQWQYSLNSGSSWTNVSDGSGGTTTSYTSRQLGLMDSGIQYRCSTTVTDGTLSTTSYSTTWTVSIITAPGSDTDTALTVSPSGGYAWAPDSPELDLSNAFTIEAWVYPTGLNTGNWSVILNKGLSYEIGIVSSDGVNGYWAYALSGYQNDNSSVKTFSGINSGIKVALNEWHHIAITRIAFGAVVQMYVDGKYTYQGTSDSATNTNIYNSTYPLVIGARSSTGETFTTAFKGKIDQIQIYGASLDQAAITSDVTRYQSRSATDLKFLYDFNEGSGSTIFNRVTGSTQNTNLTIVNGTTWSPLATIESTSTLSGYRYVKFTRTILTTGDKGWRAPADVTRVTALIVAGGGGGGYNAGGGGSGGGIAYLKSAPLSTFNKVVVGQGGSTSVGDSSFTLIIAGSAGNNSSFLTATAIGGSPGGSSTGSGGMSIYTNNTTSGSSQATNSGRGGSSAQSGVAPVAGDVGLAFSLLGVSETYSSGGSGGGGFGYAGAISFFGGGKGGDTSTAGANGAAGLGAGGGGGGKSSTSGGLGGNGVIIVRWLAVVKPVFTQPSNVFVTVGQVESFSVNMMADSATAGLTRTFRWESSTAGDVGPWVKVKEGTGYSNTFFSWTPADTSTTGNTFLYRVIVTDSDTAGLYVQDTSTAVYATISASLRLIYNTLITKSVGVSKTETMAFSGGATPVRYTLSPVSPFFSIDTSTVTSPRLIIADTATIGTYYETLTVTDSNSATLIAPMTIIVFSPPTLSVSSALVDSGTVISLDAANTASYPKSGSTWSDTSGNGYNANLTYAFGATQKMADGTSRTSGMAYLNSTTCTKPTYSSSSNGELVFDGVGNCGYIPNVGLIEQYTVELWVKRDGDQAAGYSTLLANPYRSQGDELNINITYRSGNSIGAEILTSTKNYQANSGATSDKTWIHVCVTYDGANLKIMLNNNPSLITTTPVTGVTWNKANLSTGLIIGNYMAGSTNNIFKGSIGGIRVYNRVLSSAEITQNYNASKGRFLTTANSVAVSKKWGATYNETYTVSAGSETVTATFASNNPLISWDTSTAKSLKLSVQPTLPAGTYSETVTVTDIYGASTYWPISIVITGADTLTVSVETATVLTYNGKPAVSYPKIVIKGLLGTDSATAQASFTSLTYTDSLTVPTNADTYTVQGTNLTFSSGSLSNYAGVVYETSTLTILRAKQTPLNIFLYGGVVGLPFPIIPQGGSGTGAVTEILTGTSTIPGCSISNHTLFSTTTIQGFCEVRVVKNQDQNYFAETATVQMYFLKYSLDQPSGLVGGGTTIALNGKTTLTIDDTVTAVAPMITGFTLVGSTLTISGYGFGSAPVTVQFYRYVNASPNPTPSNSGQTIQVAVPSGASTGPVIVITATGMAATDEVTIP